MISGLLIAFSKICSLHRREISSLHVLSLHSPHEGFRAKSLSYFESLNHSIVPLIAYFLICSPGKSMIIYRKQTGDKIEFVARPERKQTIPRLDDIVCLNVSALKNTKPVPA